MAAQSDDPTAMYVRAMDRAERVEDKRLVLSGLGGEDSALALDLVEKHGEAEELRSEAALAAVQIAERLRGRDDERAKATLQRLAATAPTTDVKERAQAALNDMTKFEDHILTWLVAGPYTVEHESGETVFNTKVGPEVEGAEVDWKPLDKGIGAWDINFENFYGSIDNCAAFVQTRVWSPADQDVQLEVGSDDAFRAWVNGEIVHDEWRRSGLTVRDRIVPAHLNEGWNDLMLKVADAEGGWAASCRIRARGGKKLEGLKIEAQ